MLLQPNETGDYVKNITDWTAQVVHEIMAPAWELARRVEAAEAKLAESATRLAELEAALTAQQWRPVTEKPFQEDIDYLVLDLDWCVERMRWTEEGWMFGGAYHSPTHWMPLPPAPAETTL